MKRWLLSAAVLLALGAVGYRLSRKSSYGPKPGLDPSPFRIESVGQGTAITFQPGDIPLRTRAWTRPLPGGAALMQVLSQSGRQQVYLFDQGRLSDSLVLECPQGVPAKAFAFAELSDAAWVPGKMLLLLYHTPQPDSPSLLLQWDLARHAVLGSYQGTGSRVVLSPTGTVAYLVDPNGPIQRLRLTGKSGGGLSAASVTRLALPEGVSGVSDVLPENDVDLLVAWPGGLAAYHAGTWALQPSPAPSLLGFPAGQGSLARTGTRFWWQPEPGRLQEVSPDGRPLAEEDLGPLLSGAHGKDAQLLKLLGSDAQGHLWFSPESPTFRPVPPPSPQIQAPAPAAPPMIPSDAAASVAAPAQPASVPITPTPEDAWKPYLAAGLARLYRWTPGQVSMKTYDWTQLWPHLGAPADLHPPDGDGGLVPAAGGLLLAGETQHWWLPLSALDAAQPR